MKSSSKAHRITVLMILLSLSSTTLYLIFRNLPFNAGSFALLWAPLALIGIFMNNPGVLFSGKSRLVLFYGAVSVFLLQYTLWKYMSEWNRIRILYEFFYIFIFFSIWNYFRIKRDFSSFAFISKWVFIFISITVFTTNLALFFDNSIVRESANTAEFTSYQKRIFNLMGCMDYSYAQGVICLIPILVYFIRSNQKIIFSKAFLIGILILIIFLEFRSMVFANLMVTIIITVLSLVSFKNRVSFMLSIAVFIMVLVLIPNSFYSTGLMDISTHFKPESVINRKLVSLAGFIDEPEIDHNSDIGGRAERYPMLYEALLEKPIFGFSSFQSTDPIGGGAHLYWMNRLAIWGVPGFVLFILLLFTLFRHIGSHFNYEYKFYYYLSILAFVLLGLLKAIGGREIWLMLFVINPGLYFLQEFRSTIIYRKNKLIKPSFRKVL